MKITQVTPGIISIPPNGWGAVEKVIWEYHNNIKELGHECEIKYLSQVDNSSDIVHIHMANLAIEAANQGIPYIFSLHDHHVVYYGKDSFNYKQNLEAIKRSVISFTHAEFLVDYFDETDKLFFLSHGVHTEYFKTNQPKRTEHRLLCLANNGIGGDSTYDRKGFRFAIEAAMKLNLPITVAGPENNRIFFEHHNDLLDYEKLTLIFSNPNEEQILDLYKTHSIFLHPSMLEAGHPNLTLLEAVSCNLPVVGTYLGSQKIQGMVVVERDVDQIVNGINQVIQNYDFYLNNTELDRQKYDWSIITKRMVRIYQDLINSKQNYNSVETKKKFDLVFENTEIKPVEMMEKIEIINHYIQGALVEIKGNSDKKYLVEFWNQKGDCEYREEIGCNMWVKLSKKYFDNYTLKVYSDGQLIDEKKYNAENKRVYIALDSKSLGDTFAWVPYAEEFRKKHNCKVICSTFFNDLFVKQYPEIQFVSPGSTVHNLYAMYEIGWFYDGDNVKMDRHPSDFKLGPLQKTATDILGLEYKEVKPLIKNPNKVKKKRVGLGIHSTAQAKYWNNPNGWQEITDYLISLGYEVIIYSKEEDGYMGNRYPKGAKQNPPGSIYKLIEELSTCEFFIGISSGISWVTWALDIPTVLISGFTEEFNEPYNNVYKVSAPENTCRGCANKFRLDPGDWNWCPINKGNEKMFECSKKITSEMVIDKINELVSEKTNNFFNEFN